MLINGDSQLARFGVRAGFFASLDSVEQIYVKDLRKQKWVWLKIEGKKQNPVSSFFLLKIPHFHTHSVIWSCKSVRTAGQNDRGNRSALNQVREFKLSLSSSTMTMIYFTENHSSVDSPNLNICSRVSWLVAGFLPVFKYALRWFCQAKQLFCIYAANYAW